MENEPIWECFCDEAYYGYWAVRRRAQTAWGDCYHLNSREEAQDLTALLNKHRVP